MSRNGRVIIAMSGGVDSSVAACLLKEQGYQCVGVFMRAGVVGELSSLLGDQGSKTARQLAKQAATDPPARDSPAFGAGARVLSAAPGLRHRCCSTDDALDARAVAGRLGIPFYVLNFRREFEELIEYFANEYLHGRTPNPCIRCNSRLKFGKLLRYADLLDAEYVATGHYARIVECLPLSGEQWGVCPAGRPALVVDVPAARPITCLARGANPAKDQSYALFEIRRADLPRCLFPLGEIPDKLTVRQVAAKLGLRVHDKAESQEICFVPGRDYVRLIRQWRPEAGGPGPIRDRQGRLLGTHRGLVGYTIGQRRGLGIALGKPVYVTRLDVASNTVTVGPREELLGSELAAERVNWLVDAPPPEGWHKVAIKIRYTHTPAAGAIRVLPGEPGNGEDQGSRVQVRFDLPQVAITPGQAAVFYHGQIVLGGGWIASDAGARQ